MRSSPQRHRGWLALLSCAAGCAGAQPNSEPRPPSPAIPEPVSQQCPNRQRIRPVDGRELEPVRRAFSDRNGPGWSVHFEAPDRQFTTAISGAKRTSPPAASLTDFPEARAAQIVREFIVANWDLIGFKARAGAEGATIAVSHLQPPPEYRWFVEVQAHERGRAFEGIEGAPEGVLLRVQVRHDGEIHEFWREPLIPDLTLSVVPRVSSHDPKVVANVLGRRLVYTAGAYEPDRGTTFEAGPIVAEDIKETTLYVGPDLSGGSGVVPPAWQLFHKLRVERDALTATFYVDTCSGVTEIRRLGRRSTPPR